MSNHRDQRSSKNSNDTSSSHGGRGRQANESTGGSHRDEKVNSHERAAFHHETAAHHHQQAAKHATAGNHDRSDLHAEAAQGHGRRAAEHGAQTTRRGENGDEGREVLRHTLSQNDDRSRDSGDQDDQRDLAGQDDSGSPSTRRSESTRRGAGGDEDARSTRSAGRGEGDESEKQPDEDDDQRPVNGQRRTEGRHQESSRRNA